LSSQQPTIPLHIRSKKKKNKRKKNRNRGLRPFFLTIPGPDWTVEGCAHKKYPFTNNPLSRFFFIFNCSTPDCLRVGEQEERKEDKERGGGGGRDRPALSYLSFVFVLLWVYCDTEKIRNEKKSKGQHQAHSAARIQRRKKNTP
jgi:hypothetical protein